MHLLARVWIVALVLLILSAGCLSSVQRITSSWSVEHTLAALEAEHDANRIDELLVGIATHPNRRMSFTRFLDGWGNRSEQYDLSVLKFLGRAASESVYELHSEDMEILQSRLATHPSLLRQIFWHSCWQERELFRFISSDGSASALDSIHAHWWSVPRRASEKYFALLLIASMCNEPKILEGLNDKSVDARWTAVGHWLTAYAPYFRFDQNLCVFVVDEEAYSNKMPVSSSMRQVLPPAAPLPESDRNE